MIDRRLAKQRHVSKGNLTVFATETQTPKSYETSVLRSKNVATFRSAGNLLDGLHKIQFCVQNRPE